MLTNIRTSFILITYTLVGVAGGRKFRALSSDIFRLRHRKKIPEEGRQKRKQGGEMLFVSASNPKWHIVARGQVQKSNVENGYSKKQWFLPSKAITAKSLCLPLPPCLIPLSAKSLGGHKYCGLLALWVWGRHSIFPRPSDLPVLTP